MKVRRKLVREFVQQILREHGVIDSPVPVLEIAESRNIVVVEQDVEDEVSGFLLRQPQSTTSVIGVNGRHCHARKRFTIAHELGHFCLRHGGEAVHVDKAIIKLRDEASSLGTSSEEVEANLFAAELLMPANLLSRDLQQYGLDDFQESKAIEELACKYQVSVQAMSIRLSHLGYFLL